MDLIPIPWFLFGFVFFPTFGGDKTSDVRIALIAHRARAYGISGPVKRALCIGAARVRGEAGVKEAPVEGVAGRSGGAP